MLKYIAQLELQRKMCVCVNLQTSFLGLYGFKFGSQNIISTPNRVLISWNCNNDNIYITGFTTWKQKI